MCVTATGAVRGRKLGPARLGRTRKAQRRILKGVHRRTRRNLDRYCAVGGGTFKVAYPTAKLGRSLRPKLRNSVVLIATTSPHFSLNRIRRGGKARVARRLLKGERILKLGGSTWYVAKKGGSRVFVNTRGGKVRAIGNRQPKAHPQSRPDGALPHELEAVSRFARSGNHRYFGGRSSVSFLETSESGLRLNFDLVREVVHGQD